MATDLATAGADTPFNGDAGRVGGDPTFGRYGTDSRMGVSQLIH